MYISTTKTLAFKGALTYCSSPPQNRSDPKFCWHASVKKHEGKEYLFLLNLASRFLIVLGKPDYKKITEQIREGMREGLLNAGISPKEVETYFKKAGDFKYGEASSKRFANWLTKQAKEAFVRIDYYESREKSFSLSAIGPQVSILPVKPGYKSNHPIIPIVQLTQMMRDVNNLSRKVYPEIFKIRSVLLGSALKTERTFLIRSDASFQELSNILMELYDFDGYHLYEFSIFDTKRKYHPNYRVVDDRVEDKESPFFLSGPFKFIETDREIAPFFKKANHIVYEYDFGDSWDINLTLKGTYCGCENDHAFLPYLLSASGPSPIEDIGGIHIYNDLIYALRHPDIAAEYPELRELVDLAKEVEFSPEYELEIPEKIKER